MGDISKRPKNWAMLRDRVVDATTPDISQSMVDEQESRQKEDHIAGEVADSSIIPPLGSEVVPSHSPGPCARPDLTSRDSSFNLPTSVGEDPPIVRLRILVFHLVNFDATSLL